MDPLLATLIGGGIIGGVGVKLLDIFWDFIKGRTTERRGELNRMATMLKQSEMDRDEAERRTRIATEHAHEVRMVAIGLGAKSEDLPRFDFDRS